MKQQYKSIIGVVHLIVAVILLSGCQGLPDSLVHKAQRIPERLIQQEALLKESQALFDKLSTSTEWPFIKPYLEKEHWSDNLVKARKEFDTAKAFYSNNIVPMLDRNDPKEGSQFGELVIKFDQYMDRSTVAANKPGQRVVFLINARKTAPEIHKKAKQEYTRLKTIETAFKAKARKAQKDYPNKKTDIDKRIAELVDMVSKGHLSVTRVNEQFNNRPGTDYAIFGDESVNISSTLKTAQDYQKRTNSKLDELYGSYTKVLADQRIEYYVVIGRANWCEGDYCGDGTTRYYPPVKVDDKVFEYFDSLTVNTIATVRPSWGDRNFKLNIPAAQWKALGIQELWNWPRGDDYAEYWVEKTYVDSYHRYIEIANDKVVEGKWEKVSADSFWKQYDNLGMAIFTKPYGYYVEDAIREAQPVGMANIAKPTMQNGVAVGSNQYGEWRHEGGRSFWHYYGMYRLIGDLTGSRRYYYDDWYGYNGRTRGKPYYGRDDQYGTYGSSTYSNSRYRNSDFAKRNPGDVKEARTSRTSRSSTSIRSAGKATRSRGPAGGGK